jgi:hypothetical protein
VARAATENPRQRLNSGRGDLTSVSHPHRGIPMACPTPKQRMLMRVRSMGSVWERGISVKVPHICVRNP